MIIKVKRIIAPILICVFMLGLVQGLIVKYSDDSAIVFQLESQDSQDDSESSGDGDLLEYDMLVGQLFLSKKFELEKHVKVYTYLTLKTKLFEISQPTPPPELLG